MASYLNLILSFSHILLEKAVLQYKGEGLTITWRQLIPAISFIEVLYEITRMLAHLSSRSPTPHNLRDSEGSA